jgi:hypothetical protein
MFCAILQSLRHGTRGLDVFKCQVFRLHDNPEFLLRDDHPLHQCHAVQSEIQKLIIHTWIDVGSQDRFIEHASQYVFRCDHRLRYVMCRLFPIFPTLAMYFARQA